MLEQNHVALRTVNLSAIKSLMKMDSSINFVSLNNILQLLLGNDFATKNDGRDIYFIVRDILVDLLCKKVKENFQQVDSSCFSLDKAVVKHTSFTVIISYFFWEGKIDIL